MYRRRRGMGSISDDIAAAASRYNVPPSLALAVAQRESGLNQSARGTSGEIGVFQLMPGTASELGVNPSDLSQNIDGGVRYLSQMFQRFGDWRTALEAYNGGPGNVARGTVSSAAVSYADGILGASSLDSGTLDTFPGAPDTLTDLGTSEGAGLSDNALWGLGIAGAGLLLVLALD